MFKFTQEAISCTQLLTRQYFQLFIVSALFLLTITNIESRICFVSALTIAPTTKVTRTKTTTQKTEVTNKIPIEIEWHPSRVSLEHITYKYPPETLWRRMTSSVPRRELAIDDFTVSFESEFRLVVGASSSGKSTLLQLIMGETEIPPQSGSIQITALDHPVDTCYQENSKKDFSTSTLGTKETEPTSSINILSITTQITAQPILLNERPNFSNSKQTVRSLIRETISKCVQRNGGGGNRNLNKFIHVDNLSDILVKELAVDIFDLPLDENPSRLSPSENYKISLAVASLQSMLRSWNDDNFFSSSAKDQNTDYDSKVNNKHNKIGNTVCLPSPILLLDEWMDTETSTVIHKVQESLTKLVDRGAVVISVTHKQDRYKSFDPGLRSCSSPLTLCRGRILTS